VWRREPHLQPATGTSSSSASSSSSSIRRSSSVPPPNLSLSVCQPHPPSPPGWPGVDNGCHSTAAGWLVRWLDCSCAGCWAVGRVDSVECCLVAPGLNRLVPSCCLMPCPQVAVAVAAAVVVVVVYVANIGASGAEFDVFFQPCRCSSCLSHYTSCYCCCCCPDCLPATADRCHLLVTDSD